MRKIAATAETVAATVEEIASAIATGRWVMLAIIAAIITIFMIVVAFYESLILQQHSFN